MCNMFDDATEALSEVRAWAKDELDGCEAKAEFAYAVIGRVGDILSDDDARSSAEEESVA